MEKQRWKAKNRWGEKIRKQKESKEWGEKEKENEALKRMAVSSSEEGSFHWGLMGMPEI
jgi:hypothetical protein